MKILPVTIDTSYLTLSLSNHPFFVPHLTTLSKPLSLHPNIFQSLETPISHPRSKSLIPIFYEKSKGKKLTDDTRTVIGLYVP